MCSVLSCLGPVQALVPHPSCPDLVAVLGARGWGLCLVPSRALALRIDVVTASLTDMRDQNRGCATALAWSPTRAGAQGVGLARGHGGVQRVAAGSPARATNSDLPCHWAAMLHPGTAWLWTLPHPPKHAHAKQACCGWDKGTGLWRRSTCWPTGSASSSQRRWAPRL